MARGWESKAVEDQLAERDSVGTAPDTRSDEARSLDGERASIMMARARVQQDLQTACDRRYRALLERSLEHLEAELHAVESRAAALKAHS